MCISLVNILESRHRPTSQATGRRPTSVNTTLKFTASDSGHDSVPVPETPASSPQPAVAMNDTGKVKRLRPFTADARIRHTGTRYDQLTAAAAASPTMDDFHRVSFYHCVLNFCGHCGWRTVTEVISGK